MERFKERLAIRIAWLMPRWLVMWCAIRVGAHATTGQWGSQVVPDLKFMDALQRWDHKPCSHLEMTGASQGGEE
ncbi:hypothetical protein TomTYG75_07050 [Sphingobium sp. TomTYG75]